MIYLQEDVENGHSTNEEQGETVRDLQASHSVHGDMQGVSWENTSGNTWGQVRPQSSSSGGQRNTVRAERGNGTLLSAESEEQEVNPDNDSAPRGITELSAADKKKDAFQKATESVTGYKELTEEQKTIRDIGRQLGWKVEFAPVRTPKGRKADGKISFKTKTITIDPNKKRTEKWLSLNRLSLPLGENRTGPIRKITYSGGKVKVQNSTKKTEMQLALEKAGVINSYGNSIFNDKENDTSENESFSISEKTDIDSVLDAVSRGEMSKKEAKALLSGENSLDSAVEVYTEEQYNNFGWVRANDVLTAAEHTTLLSRYADFKHNKDKYPVTRFGEAVIHSTECPDVLMYVKGKIRSPKITKIVRIVDDNSYVRSMIIEEVLKLEREQTVSPLSFIRDIYGEEIFSVNRQRDNASFQEFQRRRERSVSSKNNTLGREEQDRGRGIAEGENTNNRNDEKVIEQEGYEKARENWSKNNYIMTEKMSMV